MDTVGERIRAWRRRRGGMAQKQLAELSGLSQAYISMLEVGTKPLDRRSTQVAIANALDITVNQLLGLPAEDADPVRDRAMQLVPDLRTTLVELEYGEVRQPAADQDAVWTAVAESTNLRCAADYGHLMPMLPGLLRNLAGHGPTMAAGLVETLFSAQFALRIMGYRDLARDAARLGLRYAELTSTPAWQAQARYSLVQALPVEQADIGIRIARQAAEEVQGAPGRDATEAYGALNLLIALQAATVNDSASARAHLTEAADAAAHVGEPVRRGALTAGWNGNWFGPTQVAIWTTTIGAELEDPGMALSAAGQVDLDLMPPPNRRVYYWTDQARALAQADQDREAMHALAKAERAAPQHFRFSGHTREMVTSLIARAKRRAVGEELAHLARTLGLEPI